MTLTKREKRLLFLLAVVIVAVCIFRFGMMPLHEKLLEEQQRLQEVSAERAEMEEILRDGKLAKQYRQAAREAEDNYGSFHSILNSYTIDNILNGLMEDTACMCRICRSPPTARCGRRRSSPRRRARRRKAKKKAS